MKLIDVKQLTQKAIAQTMGSEYMEQVGDLTAMNSYQLADVGKVVTSETTISSLNNNLLATIGRHIIDNREYTRKFKSLFVDNFEWGGFIERTRVGLGEILNDPLYQKTVGTNYSEIEHTYYGQETISKIYEEGKAIMCPISTESAMLRDAFNSWEQLNAYISAKEMQIRNTINLAYNVYSKMILSCAVAISDKATNTAIHLITEAVALGIIEQVNEGTTEEPNYRNPTYDEVFSNSNFLRYCAKRINETCGNMTEISTAFNDGTIPTWANDVNLFLIDEFTTNINYYLKADVFNKEMLGLPSYETVVAWQGIDDGIAKPFDRDTLTTIDISADPTNKLKIGTNAYKKSGVVGIALDKMACGITLDRVKVTSSYTACADFWNTFHHVLVNYIIDSSYGMVAFIMD